MNTRILLPLLCLVALIPSHALPREGQDILVGQLAADEDPTTNRHHALVTSGGILLDAVALELPDGSQGIRVFRSTNEGSTWQHWGDVTDPSPYAQFQGVQAVVTRTASSERLLIAFTRWDISDANPYRVRVISARIGTAEPNWVSMDIMGPSSTNFLNLSLDVLAVEGGPSHIHLGYIGRQNGVTWDRKFVHSLDGGATWSAPLSLGSVGSLSYFEQDLVSDSEGTVHWFWTERLSGDSTTSLFLQTAQNDGTLAGDWGPVTTLLSDGETVFQPFATADPTGDGLLVALQEYNQARLLFSPDQGATWPHPATVLENVYGPAPAWGSDGPAVGLKFNDLPGYFGLHGFGLARPEGAPEGAWSIEPMTMGDDNFSGEASIVALPQREGKFAVIGLVDGVDRSAAQLLFDAEWRGGPGFGVLENPVPFAFDASLWLYSPVAGDIDGDGDQEIIYITYSPDPELWRYDLETGTATVLMPIEIYLSALDPALVDVDGDGALEIFFTSGVELFGIRGDGTPLPGFPASISGGYGSFVSGGAVTGSQPGELVVGVDSRRIALVAPDGSMQPGFPYDPPEEAPNKAGRVAIGDVDNDGRVDLVASYYDGVAIVSNTGEQLNYFEMDSVQVHSPSLADLDGDGDLEIALPTLSGQILLMHHTGESFGPGWPHDTGTGLMTESIALADLTGDGRRDLITVLADSTIHVIDTDGQPITQLPLVHADGMHRRSPIVTRLGPAGMAVARGDADGLMHIFTGAQEQDGWPRDFGAPIQATSLAADLDGDDSVELVVISENAMWVLDMGVAPGPFSRGWRMEGATPGRTNCADCPFPTLSAVGAPVLPPVPVLLHQNAPNPFNPSTTIRFEVPDQESRVRLRIFDTRGRLVQTLVDDSRTAGTHAATWDGRDAGGRAVSSGVYLARLDVGGISQMRSMVLMK